MSDSTLSSLWHEFKQLRDPDAPLTLFETYFWMLCQAESEDITIKKGVKKINLLRGQLLTTYREMINECKLNRRKILHYLNSLRERNEIVCTTTPHYTLLTICNYDEIVRSHLTEKELTKHPFLPEILTNNRIKGTRPMTYINHNNWSYSIKTSVITRKINFTRNSFGLVESQFCELVAKRWVELTGLKILRIDKLVPSIRRATFLLADLMADELAEQKNLDEQKKIFFIWNAYFQRVLASDYLMGRAGDWRCDFRWLLKPGNMEKVVEGRYDNVANGYAPLTDLIK